MEQTAQQIKIKEVLTELETYNPILKDTACNHTVVIKHSYKFKSSIESAKVLIEDCIRVSDDTIKNFVWQPEYDEIAEWLCDNKGKGLFMFGKTGVGKSRILYTLLPLVFHELKEKLIVKPVKSYDMTSSNYRELMTRPIIAIDEVGRELEANDYGSKFQIIEILADHCEFNGNLFFGTSNFTFKQLEERYKKPCMERFGKICKLIGFGGETNRIPK